MFVANFLSNNTVNNRSSADVRENSGSKKSDQSQGRLSRVSVRKASGCTSKVSSFFRSLKIFSCCFCMGANSEVVPETEPTGISLERLERDTAPTAGADALERSNYISAVDHLIDTPVDGRCDSAQFEEKLAGLLRNELQKYSTSVKTASSAEEVKEVRKAAINGLNKFNARVENTAQHKRDNFKILGALDRVNKRAEIMDALINILFETPLEDSRVTGVLRSKAVRKVTVPYVSATSEGRENLAEHAETKTFFLVNRPAATSVKGAVLGRGANGTVRAALPAKTDGGAIGYASDNELAVKKIGLLSTDDIVSTYKEVALDHSLSHISGVLKAEACFVYPSYKGVRDKGRDPSKLTKNLAIVMEKGRPLKFLKKIISGMGSLSDASIESLEKQRMGQYLQIAETLVQVHEAGKVHNDLKFDNVLCNNSGEAKVIDFGGAFDLNSSLKENNIVSRQLGGTYYPPEVGKFREDNTLDIADLKYPEKIDVWALGNMILDDWFSDLGGQCHFFRQPEVRETYFDKDHSEALIQFTESRFELLDSRYPSNSLANVVKQCMDPDPEKRASMKEVAEALKGIIAFYYE